MKVSISNLLLFVALVAMATFLMSQRTNQTVTLHCWNTGYRWFVPRLEIERTHAWEDMTSPPPLQICDALKIVEEIGDDLALATKDIGFARWQFEGIRLVPFGRIHGEESKHWCYVASFRGGHEPYRTAPGARFKAVILMDRSILIGHGNMHPQIDDAMRKVYPVTLHDVGIMTPG